jgi:hypothetical protein
VIIWRGVDKTKLHPRLLTELEALLIISPHIWYILHGYRSLEEQGALYEKYKAGGPRAAPPDKPGLQPDWSIKGPAFQWLFKSVAGRPALKSGLSFNDADHIELAGWKLRVKSGL